MNKVILSGNIVKDIEVRRTQSGEAVVSNTVAVRREYKNVNNEYDTDFINFVAWRSQAEYLEKYAVKGDRVELVGRWQVRKYTDSNNATRTVDEVVVESITAFSKPKQETKQEPKQSAYDDFEDELPF